MHFNNYYYLSKDPVMSIKKEFRHGYENANNDLFVYYDDYSGINASQCSSMVPLNSRSSFLKREENKADVEKQSFGL
jgi:hypothetical protein